MLADTVVATFADGLQKTYSLVCSTSECALVGPNGVIADEGGGAGGGGGSPNCSTVIAYTPHWATGTGTACGGAGNCGLVTVRWVDYMESQEMLQCGA